MSVLVGTVIFVSTSGVTKDGRSETEIKTRIGVAKDAFSKRKELIIDVRNEQGSKEEDCEDGDMVGSSI